MTDTLDALLGRIDDESLRADLAERVAELKAGRKFGLVFEDRIPEAVRLPAAKIRRGSRVALRDGDIEQTRKVVQIRDGVAISIHRPESDR